MYKVLSWDIGVKNLSYCILQENSNIEGNEVSSANRTKNNYSILNWEVINLYPDEIKVEYECSGLTSKKQICGKKSKYINDNKYYCKTHAPKDNLTNPIKLIKHNKKNKNPFEYATRIKHELDNRPFLCDVNAVIIENQPALVNPIMKTVQMIIFSYFSFKHSPDKPLVVHNINAKRKEKLPIEDKHWEGSQYQKDYLLRIQTIKNKYSRRKFICYYYATMCLENYPEMKNYLLTHTKKDDMTDSFLMCTDWLLRK